MLSLTSPIRTPFHRIPAGPKLLALLLVAGGTMALADPVPLAALLLAVAVLFAAGGAGFARHGLRVMRPVLPLVAVLMAWHLWLRAPEAGLVMILRMLVAMVAANLVTMTTRLDQMIAVVQRVAAPLRHIGLRPEALALAIALMIRFIPVMSTRVAQIGDAWRARSRRRPGWRIVMPAALAALDDAEQVSEALRARGGLS
ncbi:energy-coupling factor transporter transmembrane component T [Falsirhodobacter xinxiangensis]|uniref:energy-coupling factor transporter transmembrane component T n=1 Tax=Falsirhodobacter xinxiangensis TaxID=2530049 RepID=UPI0010AA827A|nr:energy-coupling factor transporter transmembrane component T [Rhodobacter xinxiangensis]